MEGVKLNTLIFSSVLLLTLYCVFRTLDAIWWRPKRLEKKLRQEGIRGTSYTLMCDDKKEMGRLNREARSNPMSLNHQIAPRVQPFYHLMVQKYGKISMSWNQTRARLMVVEPEVMKLILTDKHGHFQKLQLNPLIKLLALGVSTLEREKWVKRRKLITPAFHHDKLKGMVPEFSNSCRNLVDRWKKLVSPQGHCEVDIAPEFQELAADVISRTAFGSSYEEGKKIFDLQKEQIGLALEASQNIYFPGLRFIPTTKNKRRYKIDNEIKATLREMIHKKEQAMANGDKGGEDLLALLLKKSKEEADNDMTVEDLIEECKLFYFAGQETTATLLTWTIIVLSMNPNWQHKAREEVLQLCGKRTPDIEAINHLKIVSMILHEVLRLYPPLTILFRQTYKSTTIGGMSIPAGVEFVLPTLLLHYDPEYWGDDVEEFKPERFAEGVSKASKDQTYYPFGWGPRICLGQTFAMIEAKMALAMVLQHFWFELSPSYTHAPCTVITLQPQHGAPIILHQL